MKVKKTRRIRDTIFTLINRSPDMSQDDINCTLAENIVKNVYRNVSEREENDNGVEPRTIVRHVSKLTGKYKILSLTYLIVLNNGTELR